MTEDMATIFWRLGLSIGLAAAIWIALRALNLAKRGCYQASKARDAMLATEDVLSKEHSRLAEKLALVNERQKGYEANARSSRQRVRTQYNTLATTVNWLIGIDAERRARRRLPPLPDTIPIIPANDLAPEISLVTAERVLPDEPKEKR